MTNETLALRVARDVLLLDELYNTPYRKRMVRLRTIAHENGREEYCDHFLELVDWMIDGWREMDASERREAIDKAKAAIERGTVAPVIDNVLRELDDET